ncbi:UNVERIFIED_CONTAM: hypothetical protein Sradi_7002000 [Sesamum radiatum]|uniref:RNase H type-1 domain-containing protein n=1 Tax=Sesamum radiatum TaxID=300843 RepID=A0AAW2JC07_SESRA
MVNYYWTDGQWDRPKIDRVIPQRNDAKHRETGFNSKRIIWKIHNYLWSLQSNKKLDDRRWKGDTHVATKLGLKTQMHKIKEKIIVVKWRKPDPPKVKLNTDGASKGSSGLAGAGGIIRDYRGYTIVAFQEFLGTATNTLAEVQAVASGLEIAHKMGLNDIWVEMDSAVGLSLITSDNAGHWKVQHSLVKIRLLCSMMQVSFSHIYREGNFVADYFANKAVTERSSKIYSNEQLDRKAKGLISLDRLEVPNVRIGSVSSTA